MAKVGIITGSQTLSVFADSGKTISVRLEKDSRYVHVYICTMFTANTCTDMYSNGQEVSTEVAERLHALG